MIFGYETADGTLYELPYAQIDGIADWEWNASSDAYQFDQVTSHDFSVTVMFDNLATCDKILALMDEDTLNNSRGMLVMGNWSIKCNAIKGSFKARAGNMTEYQIGFRAYGQRWMMATYYQFLPTGGTSVGGLDYPHDYPHDYMSPPVGQNTINISSWGQCDFRLIVYGPVTNPAVTIGGHQYKVNATLLSGDILFVNQISKGIAGSEIFKRSSSGVVTNLFSSRDTASYIFQRLAPGENLVVWSGEFGFDLEVFETRSKIPDDRY